MLDNIKMTNNITVRTILIDKVRIHPQDLHVGLKNVIRNKLKKRFEGKCSHHGYIVPNSIVVYKYSLGMVKAISLNGDVESVVHYYADVCNPALGSIFKAKVINMNKLGVLTQSFLNLNDEDYPVIDTIIVSQVPSDVFKSDVDLSHIKIGDEINVEIIGKKFELNDKKISTIGKIIHSNEKTKMVNDNEFVVSNNTESNDVYNSDTETSSSNEDEDEDKEDSESNNEVQENQVNLDENQEEEDDEEPPEDNNDEENNDEEEIEIE